MRQNTNSHKIKTITKIGFALIFLFFSRPSGSYTLPLTPDNISIPKRLKYKSAEQIKVVFSSLEKQHEQKTANLWFLHYQKALWLKKKDQKLFCFIMKELGTNPVFPLNDLALIESYELCHYIKELKFNADQFPEWLRLRLAQAFYKRRRVFENPKRTLEATIYLAQNSAYKELRISYLRHALALTKEQKNEPMASSLVQLLHKEAPRLLPNPGPEDFFLVAEDFRKNRNFKQAIHFYIKVLNSLKAPFGEKHLSFKGLDRIYKIQKNNEKKFINSQRWLNWLKQENTEQSLMKYYKHYLEMAREKWNRDENAAALKLITDLLQDQKSKPVRENALYLRGMIYAQQGQIEESFKDWDEAIQQIKVKRKNHLLERILWKKAWLLRGQRKYKEALNQLGFLEDITKNPYTLYKVMFWKGKTLQDLGQRTRAKRVFRQLIKKDYFGYYGLLAYKILDQKPLLQKALSSDTLPSFSLNSKMENIIYWLSLFKESELLSLFVDMHKQKFLTRKNKTEKDWLKIISLWAKTKKYLEIFQSLEMMENDVRSNFLKKYIHLLFVLDYLEEVEKASKRWNVPKAFILAIIRQESAFNKRARSPADAFGLMQLIPSTARQTARRFKIPYRNFRNLYEPSKNILLGTAHLKELLDKYDNSFILSVAAYNAGRTPADKWKRNKNSESLDFIENIPYQETRSYIKLIIRNYIFYHNMLDNNDDSWFPEWALQ